MVDSPGLPATTRLCIEEPVVDFGDILKQWESTKRTAQADSKRQARADARRSEAGPPKAPPNKGVARLQSAWLDEHGVPDAAERDTVPAHTVHPTGRDIERMPTDAMLDLHGMTIVEAEIALNSFFATAERSGCRKLLIVHGKGLHSESEPVLAAFVERWLARRASAGRSGHATRENGGRGATWVLLKDVGNQRSR